MVSLVYGVQDVRVNSKVNEIIKNFLEDDVNEFTCITYDAEKISLQDIVSDANTLPFGFDKKVVIIKNPYFLSSSKEPKLSFDVNYDVFLDYLKNENKIKLQHNLFDNDALILNNLSSKYVDIKTINHKKYIRIYFNDFETLAIWATNDEQTKFVCLEPWSGINIDYQKINDKVGSNKLNINEEKTYSYTIQVKGE